MVIANNLDECLWQLTDGYNGMGMHYKSDCILQVNRLATEKPLKIWLAITWRIQAVVLSMRI